MRILRLVVVVPLLALCGCPPERPPQSEETTVKDTQSASQAVKERLKPGSGMPTDPAVKAIQRGLEQAEGQQRRSDDRAEAAATQQ